MNMKILSLVLVLSFMLIVLCHGLSASSGIVNVTSSCKEKEREALLTFKNSLHDPSKRLSSWVGEDCCNWAGVRCSIKTGHVVELNLENESKKWDWKERVEFDVRFTAGSDTSNLDPFFTKGRFNTCLTSTEVNPSLINLTHLKYLDLSLNNFSQSQIPKFIGNFSELRYLNLSWAQFSGAFPYSIGNLTNLIVLDLSGLLDSRIDTLSWLAHLQNLQHLYLSEVDLRSIASFSFHTIQLLPSLSELILDGCELPMDFLLALSSKSNQNLTSLSILNLRSNPFDNLTLLSSNGLFHKQFPNFIRNFTSLRVLDLTFSRLSGPLPDWLGELNNLKHLHLSANDFSGVIPKNLCNLSRLTTFDFYYNGLSGSIPACLGSLQLLEEINLSRNQLSGSIPSSLGTLSNLRSLDLSDNNLNGTVPPILGELLNLENLVLSYNSFTGNVSQTHLKKLLFLKILAISYNPLALILPSDWIPPFQLIDIRLSSCQVGLRFPLWLQTQQEILRVEISNASIKDSLPPWIFNFSSHLLELDLSYNHIAGQIRFPQFPTSILLFRLSNNFISGSIPLNINTVMSHLTVFDLSNNSITGNIPTSLFEIQSLGVIDLSKNHLSGYIPENCWSNLAHIVSLGLANNNLSGIIPNLIATDCILSDLMLSDNRLHGEIPLSLKYCDGLTIIDFGGNRFSGNIPSFIGELTQLQILRLRSNRFEGILIPGLCNLDFLHILDLGVNNFSGIIPRCLKNLSAMKESYQPYGGYPNSIKQVMKGNELEYTKTLDFLANIDLSCNFLEGRIPEEITLLSGLSGLNLSKNQLTGEIPKNIGKLKSLESLDLSYNHLSGIIPQSISELYYLSYMSLSYNNLSGRIPTGRQIQTFDASIYEGNEKLCGEQLLRDCAVDILTGDDCSDEKGDEDGKTWFYIGMTVGFVIGFWTVCGTLFFKKTWRYVVFRFAEGTHDRIVTLSRLISSKQRM